MEDYKFVDRTDVRSETLHLIPPVVIKKKDIDAEIERLANLPTPANGRRESNRRAGVWPSGGMILVCAW